MIRICGVNVFHSQRLDVDMYHHFSCVFLSPFFCKDGSRCSIGSTPPFQYPSDPTSTAFESDRSQCRPSDTIAICRITSCGERQATKRKTISTEKRQTIHTETARPVDHVLLAGLSLTIWTHPCLRSGAGAGPLEAPPDDRRRLSANQSPKQPHLLRSNFEASVSRLQHFF